jgi:hypothetical protein
MFGPLKEVLHGRRFASDDEVEDPMHTWLLSQPETFSAGGIGRLVNPYTICITKRGGYIEI